MTRHPGPAPGPTLRTQAAARATSARTSRRPAPRRVLAGSLLAASAAFAQPVVEQPRPFGHVLGDVVTQRIRLDDFQPAALTLPQRAGAWFERRAARVETGADGARWLVVDYQVVNVPPAAATLRLPAWELPAAASAPPWRVPAAPLAVAPIVPPASDAGIDLRPDRAAPQVATAALARGLAQALVAALALAAAWAGWWAWRQWRARHGQPFARALTTLGSASDEGAALRALHLAFDGTAGEVLRATTLERLFHRAPHLEAERRGIEAFYAHSEARFFGGAAAPAPPAPLALARALRKLEKAHEQ